MRLRYLKVVLAALACCAALGAQEYSFTFEECLEYAFGNSYERQMMLLDEETQREALRGAKAQRAPEVSASVGEGLTHTGMNDGVDMSGSASLNASIVLYGGGETANTIRQQKHALEQTEASNEQYDMNLTVQILEQFLTILGNEELLKYQEQLIKTSEEQLAQGKEKYAVGAILESDYLLLEAQYASDKTNALDTRIARDNNLLALKSLLSMPPEANLTIVYPDTAAMEGMRLLPTQAEAIEKAIATLPDLKLTQKSIDIAESDLKIARAGYIPTISASASVGTSHLNYDGFGGQLRDNFNQQAGISISIPIYDRSQTSMRVRQSKIKIEQAELEHRQTELELRQTVAQEYQDVVAAISKYDATDVKSEAYRKTYEAYSVQFRLGAITAVDLLQQQNNYISALNDYIQAKYGFLMKRKILDVYMGEKVEF
ncbi:MAG: TolC family protein [bacterium]|uniref:TolC family protein n=1 Tax=Candidatus Aphodosoma intestinipullorum TaxID=2840674 RepID=A0A940DKF5_9BACT|nr:TolC family protein [Candidatus Aphodosoma intestinipullorum]